jgi:acyl carrier protein
MTPEEIHNIIFHAIAMANNARQENQQIPIAPSTALYGPQGYLDSMALVAFLIDIEEAFLDREIAISLSDERAMSQTRSPFQTVESLAQYIQSLIPETV